MGKRVISFLVLFLLLSSAFASTSLAKVINPVSEAYGEGWVWRIHDGDWLRTERMEDESGNLVYCLTPAYPSPHGQDLEEMGPVDKLSANVLRVGYPENNWGLDNTKAHYATQVALYIANGSFNMSDLRFDDSSIKQVVTNILHEARGMDYSENPLLDVVPKKVQPTLSEGQYTTPVINVSGDQGTYSVSLNGAPEGAKVVNENGDPKQTFTIGEGFKILFNSENSGNFTIEIEGSFQKTTTMAYDGSPHDVQNVVQLFPITKNQSTKVAVSWTAVGDLVVTKTDKQGNPLQGVTFAVENNQGEVIAEGKSNENGLVTFENIPPGDYKVYEISTPEGYVLDPTKYDVQIKNGQKAELSIQNERIQGTLKITKYDAETNEGLAGAEFTIFNENDEEVAKVVTNEDGVASIKLPYGSYTFKETKAPDGYSLNKNVFHFEITSDGQTIEKKVDNQAIQENVESPVENNDKGDSDNSDKEIVGGKLPNTSSDNLTNAVVGFVIALAGSLLFFIRKKLPN